MITTNLRYPSHVRSLPNNIYVVETLAGSVLVNCPPETLKYLLAYGIKPPKMILLPPDVPAGKHIGSSGFVHQGINFASVEFVLYSNFFGSGGARTKLITCTVEQARRLRLLLEETIIGPRDARAYGDYLWLKGECEAVGTYPPLGRAPGPDDLAEIVSLDQGGGDLGLGVTVTLEGDQFAFRDGEHLITVIAIQIPNVAHPLTFAPARPLLRHELTLQFIGGSDGFDPAGITTCFLAYLGAKTQATLFDCAAYLRLRLGNLGISAHQISEVVLSHLHEDHLAGLPELLLMGQKRLRLITSDIIYASLLRVLSAMLAMPESEIAMLFDYFPLNPNQPLELEKRRFEAIYAVHSIPTIAVRVNTLYYSGDMRYDEAWFDELVKQRVLSEARRRELISFANGASVLVQDAGGGAIHTTITPDVLKSLAAKGQRIILAHTSKHALPTGGAEAAWASQVEFAASGYVSGMGEALKSAEDVERLETISASPLFSRLPLEERKRLAQDATLSRWEDTEPVFRKGEQADGRLYIVHSGLVELWSEGKLITVVGRGNSIGERGALRGGTRAMSLIARGSVQLLGLNAETFRELSEKLGFTSAYYRAEWLNQQPLFRELLWATLLDLALDFQPRHLQQGDWLFKYGEPGYEFYLLVSGALAVVDKDHQLIEELDKPGEFVGGRAPLYGTLRNASAYALQGSEVWALPAATLQRLQMVYPNILMHLRAVESRRHGQAGKTNPLSPNA